MLGLIARWDKRQTEKQKASGSIPKDTLRSSLWIKTTAKQSSGTSTTKRKVYFSVSSQVVIFAFFLIYEQHFLSDIHNYSY